MRIRRRPQALIPSPYPPQLQQASDPSTAPSETPPPNQHHWLPRYEEEDKEVQSYRSNVEDLGDEPSPAARRGAPLPGSHPQGGNVVGRSSGDNSPGRAAGGGAQRRQGAVADGHGSLENGHRDERQWPATNAAEERLVDGSVVLAMPLAASTVPQNVKEGTAVKSDGPKRRRGPAVLLEGSRCSRVNGRGWRCSQPTLVGYSLCEHHLGKGRQSRSGRTTAGVPKLGRTEPASSRKKNGAAALAVVPDAAETAAHLING